MKEDIDISTRPRWMRWIGILMGVPNKKYFARFWDGHRINGEAWGNTEKEAIDNARKLNT